MEMSRPKSKKKKYILTKTQECSKFMTYARGM